MSNQYTNDVSKELCSITDFDIIKYTHDLNMDEESILPHLMISGKLIRTVQNNWIKKFSNIYKLKTTNRPNIYAPYVAQTIIKYCSNRAELKKKYNL